MDDTGCCPSSKERLTARADYLHAADTPYRQDTHAAVRNVCLQASRALIDFCPEGRELSLALTKLEEAMFWANAAIARQ